MRYEVKSIIKRIIIGLGIYFGIIFIKGLISWKNVYLY